MKKSCLNKKIKAHYLAEVRCKGLFRGAGGLAMIVLGFVLAKFISEQGGTLGKGPLVIMVIGAVVALRGFVTLASGIEE